MQQKELSLKTIKTSRSLLKNMTGWRTSGSTASEKLESLMDKLAKDWDENVKSKPAALEKHEILLGYSPMVAYKFKVIRCLQTDQRKAMVLQRRSSLLEDQT